MAKVSTMALCSLTSHCLANKKEPVISKATVDVLGICNTLQPALCPYIYNKVSCADVYAYSRVGFCVALPQTGWAMRDALRSGTSNRYSDPHFLFICTNGNQ